MARRGPELLALAQECGVALLYEASVGGGIPIIAPLTRDLQANEIRSLQAIINGTTNFILTAMAQDGMSYDDALAEAQRRGYAEADPSSDVEGVDAAFKLAILASLAFHTSVHPDDVYHEGITALSAGDFRYAADLGYVIRLLAIAGRDAGGALDVRVHPTLLDSRDPLARVDGVLNAVAVEGDLLGRAIFQGEGAGSRPTTSAVVADLLDIVSNGVRAGARRPAAGGARGRASDAHARLRAPGRPAHAVLFARAGPRPPRRDGRDRPCLRHQSHQHRLPATGRGGRGGGNRGTHHHDPRGPRIGCRSLHGDGRHAGCGP